MGTKKLAIGSFDLLAVVGKVNPEVHEVVLAPTGIVHDTLQHCLVNLVRYVAEHYLSGNSAL